MKSEIKEILDNLNARHPQSNFESESFRSLIANEIHDGFKNKRDALADCVEAMLTAPTINEQQMEFFTNLDDVKPK